MFYIRYKFLFWDVIMEAIIVLVGFLGAGKTTLLRKLLEQLLEDKWDTKVILNDYENATLDAQDFKIS